MLASSVDPFQLYILLDTLSFHFHVEMFFLLNEIKRMFIYLKMFSKLPSNEREIETECLEDIFHLKKKNSTFQKINSNVSVTVLKLIIPSQKKI